MAVPGIKIIVLTFEYKYLIYNPNHFIFIVAVFILVNICKFLYTLFGTFCVLWIYLSVVVSVDVNDPKFLRITI